MAPLNVCIQVNIDEEASKSGVPPAEVAELDIETAALRQRRHQTVGAAVAVMRGDEAIAGAIQALDGSDMGGRQLRVNEAHDRPQRGGGGGGGRW